MSIKSFVEFLRYCRICMKINENNDQFYHLSENLFHHLNEENADDDDMTILDGLKKITQQKMENEGDLPQKVCITCFNRLSDAIILLNQFQQSTVALKRLSEPYESLTLKEIIEGPPLPTQTTTTTTLEIYPNEPNIVVLDNQHIENIKQSQEHTNDNKIDRKIKKVAKNDTRDPPFNAEDAVAFIFQADEAKKKTEKEAERNQQPTKYEDRRHICEICSKRFLRKSNLVDHLRLHKNERPFKCEICGREFVQSGNFKSHMRIHTNERPYQCSLCPRNYNQSGALTIHIRSHTKERNYICEICQKGFTNASDLRKHKIIHDRSKWIKCDMCTMSFAQRCHLKHHKFKHHNEQTSEHKPQE